MRALRRTPWATQADLAELYDMIYSSAADDTTRQRAVSRMSLYLSSPSCPAYIHLLHSLLSADLLPVPKTPAEKQGVRLTCAMSIVRFINGMVDPLQTGPYARPISHIAATLHIPPSLIALRHRATHEDLPPLPLLKQAIHSAIEYINQYSFLPSLASTSSEPIPRPLRAQTLVDRWKRIIKSRLKSETSEVEFERESRRLKRELDDEDVNEIAEALASVGGLIPLARKKRPSGQSAEPTKASLQIWTPLLDHLIQSNPTFITSLVDQLFTLAQNGIKGKQSEVASVKWSAIVWILWFWSDRRGPSLVDGETKTRLRKEIMTLMMDSSDLWQRFADELSDIDPKFEAAVSGLEHVLQSSSDQGQHNDDDDADALKGLEVEDHKHDDVEMTDDDALAQMEARLAKLFRRQTEASTPKVSTGGPSGHDFADQSLVNGGSNDDKGGWKQLDDTCWKPCPIGVWGVVHRSQ